jgi:hypothetical protein
MSMRQRLCHLNNILHPAILIIINNIYISGHHMQIIMSIIIETLAVAFPAISRVVTGFE